MSIFYLGRCWSENSLWSFDTVQVCKLKLLERHFVKAEDRDSTFIRNVHVSPQVYTVLEPRKLLLEQWIILTRTVHNTAMIWAPFADFVGNKCDPRYDIALETYYKDVFNMFVTLPVCVEGYLQVVQYFARILSIRNTNILKKQNIGEDWVLLGCGAALLNNLFPKFQRSMVLSSSRI